MSEKNYSYVESTGFVDTTKTLQLGGETGHCDAWLQLDIEVDVSTAVVGSVAVLIRTPGMSKFKTLIDPDTNAAFVFDLSKPYPASFESLRAAELKFVPTGVTAGAKFNVVALFDRNKVTSA